MKFRPAQLLAVLAVMLLGSCATVTKLAYSNAAFAYSNLASMATWMVDEYVDLDGRQKDWVRERITRAMAWHRAQELPRYRQFLEHVLRESAEPFTAAEIGDAYNDLRGHYRRMVEHMLPDVADFFLQLDADQVAQMEKKFADDNRKFTRESVKGTPEERVERRASKFMDHMEVWVGSLARSQRELLARHYAAIPDLVEERLGERRYRQAELLSLVRAKGGKDAMVAGLHRLLVDTESWRRPEFERQQRERDRRIFEMMAAFSATLSPAQRTHLQERIRNYLNDIGELTSGSRAQQGRSPRPAS